jgi:YcxB-like protein
MVRQSVRTFVRRTFFRGRLAAILVLVAVVGLTYFQAERNSEALSFSDGLFVASLLLLPFYIIVVWRAHHVTRIGQLRMMDPPEADLTFTDTDMTIVSSLGATTLPWRHFVEVWELPRFWMLFQARNQFITLPVDEWSPEVIQFVRSKLPRHAQSPSESNRVNTATDREDCVGRETHTP